MTTLGGEARYYIGSSQIFSNGPAITSDGTAYTLQTGAAGVTEIVASNAAGWFTTFVPQTHDTTKEDGSSILIDTASPTVQADAAIHTINGQRVKVGPAGIVIGSGSGATTIPLSSAGSSLLSGLVTIGSEVFTASETNGGLVLSNPATIISLDPGLESATVNVQLVSAIESVAGDATTGTSALPPTYPSETTVAGIVSSGDPQSQYVLPGGETLAPGALVTMSGSVISLAPDGSPTALTSDAGSSLASTAGLNPSGSADAKSDNSTGTTTSGQGGREFPAAAHIVLCSLIAFSLAYAV